LKHSENRTSATTSRRRRQKSVIGWREFVSLPDFPVDRIKAKIDTGARSSAIHAWNICLLENDGRLWISFNVHPIQRNNQYCISCVAPLVGKRLVTSSNGHREERLIVKTTLGVGSIRQPIELSLTNRDSMGFRLLLGRTAVRRHFIVDAGRSYLMERTRP
jgi:hypothetical protein